MEFKNLEKRCNGKSLHPYKVNVITFRSQECLDALKKINKMEDVGNIQEKLCHDNILNVLYNRWNPTFLYITLYEVHVVKFYEENDNYTLLYNGNINKILTSLSSAMSLASNLEFSASYVEFDNDNDVYPYICSKQKECYRNALNIFWSKIYLKGEFNGIFPEMNQIEKMVNDEDHFLNNYKYGIFIKQGTRNLSKEWSVMSPKVLENKNKFVYFTTRSF